MDKQNEHQLIERIVGNRIEASKVSDYRHEPVPHYNSFNHQTDARRFIHHIERRMNLSDILFYFTGVKAMNCSMLSATCASAFFQKALSVTSTPNTFAVSSAEVTVVARNNS